MKTILVVILTVLFCLSAALGQFVDNKPFVTKWSTSADTVFDVSRNVKADTSQPFEYFPDMTWQIDCAQAGDSGFANIKIQFSMWPLGASTDWNDSICGGVIELWDSNTTVLTETALRFTDGSVDCPIKTARIIVDKAGGAAYCDLTVNADSAIAGTIRGVRYK
jgi:hypothetical protein